MGAGVFHPAKRSVHGQTGNRDLEWGRVTGPTYVGSRRELSVESGVHEGLPLGACVRRGVLRAFREH